MSVELSDPHYTPATLVLKLMSALPALCQYAGVPVNDVTSLDQWNECGYACLLKHKLASPEGPRKEVINVVTIWLRVLATRHQSEVAEVTMLAQKWYNMYGRWPITIAFFVSSAPSAKEPLLPPGQEPENDEVPNGLRGDVYDAAMRFKAYLLEQARDHTALPMVPVLWEDNFSLRIALSRILRSGPPLSPGLLNHATHALEVRARNGSPNHSPNLNSVSQDFSALRLGGNGNVNRNGNGSTAGSPPASEPSATPRATPNGDHVNGPRTEPKTSDSRPAVSPV